MTGIIDHRPIRFFGLRAKFVQGGEEFKSLASTFNAMQTGIAEREARITHQAHHDALTGLPNRLYVERRLAGAASTSDPVDAYLNVSLACSASFAVSPRDPDALAAATDGAFGSNT